MRADDIAFVIALCKARAGLTVAADKPYLIESRLNPVARGEGLAGADALVVAARESGESRLSWRIVEAMAAGETAFFGDRTVFEGLRTRILPELIAARAGAPLKVWSAACSTGQEVYSLAMAATLLADSGLAGANAIELFGSDIASADLERAKEGLYTQSEVQRGLPIRLLIRFFQKQGDFWRIAPELRRRVRWRRVDLIASMENFGRFDVIFCRNVISAMDLEARATALGTLCGVLAPDGYLILGPDEGGAAREFGLEAAEELPGVYRFSPERRSVAA